MEINVKIAGVPFSVILNNEENAAAFEEYLSGEAPLFRVSLSRDYLEKAKRYYPVQDGRYVEFSELQFAVSRELQRYSLCAFHALSFTYEGRAYLITGRSGVGKTTQYRNLKALYGDRIGIMSGDKVLLGFGEDGITVHSCPWKGKENMGTVSSAPLGGIVLLEQKKENTISLMENIDAALPVLKQFITLYESRDEAKLIASFAEKLIEAGGVYLLRNNGDSESSALLFGTLIGKGRENG